MTQQQVEMRKKELEQSLDQVQNSLKNIMQEMERDLKLNQNFFWCDNVVHEQKKILKRQLKNHIIRGITVQQKLNQEIF